MILLDKNVISETQRQDINEERFVLMGYSSKLKLLVVCHCYRAKGQTIRIISARKATKQEAKFYKR